MPGESALCPDDGQTARLVEAGFATPIDWEQLSISQCLEAARVLVLKVNEEQTTINFRNPLNPRNEAAALSLLTSNRLSVCGAVPSNRWTELQELCNSYVKRTQGSTIGEQNSITCREQCAESELLRWAQEHGLEGDVEIAVAKDGLRGLQATKTVEAGECVLAVPASLLISIRTLRDSDLGSVLEGNLDEDSAMLIYTMVDRHDPDSELAHFWAALPTRFQTGLSVAKEELEILAETTAYQEVMQARMYVRESYDAVAPALTDLAQRYPSIIKAEHMTWEDYLWAAELWYSYGLQVQFGDGAVHSCLVPVASLMNHSPWPHVVHFSKLDAVEQRLRLITFRRCTAGEQLFLSYGPNPNLQLLLFYGFCLPNNPHDSFAVNIEMPDDELSDLRAAALEAHGLRCSVDLPPSGPLPPALLGVLRIASATEEELEKLGDSVTDLKAPLSEESDELALGMLQGLLEQLSEPFLVYAQQRQADSSNSSSELQGFAKYADIYMTSTAAMFQNALSEAAQLAEQMQRK